MRTLITLAILISHFIAFSQEYKYDETTKSVIIQDVISSELSKEDLHSRCQVFITSRYTDSDKLILLDDKDIGILTTTARMNFWTEDYYWSVKFDIKDQKVRYTVSDIHQINYNMKSKFDRKGLLNTRNKLFKRIGETLHSELTSALAVDDW